MTALDVHARKQHGCLHHRQILGVVSRYVLSRRIEQGSYVPVHRGVVRLAAFPDTPTSRCWAAVLAVGEPVAVTGASAVLLYGVTAVGIPDRVNLVVPCSRRGTTDNRIRIHRISDWSQRSWRHREGLRLASLSDAIIDLAAELPVAQVFELVEQLLWRQVTPEQLRSRLITGRPGCGIVRKALQWLSDGQRSVHERKVAAGLRRRGVPPFETNVLLRDEHGIAVAELDFRWKQLRVVVQLDGWRYHNQGTFQQDHDVPNDLVIGGDYVVLRFTGHDVEYRLDSVLDRIEIVLRRQRQRLGDLKIL